MTRPSDIAGLALRTDPENTAASCRSPWVSAAPLLLSPFSGRGSPLPLKYRSFLGAVLSAGLLLTAGAVHAEQHAKARAPDESQSPPAANTPHSEDAQSDERKNPSSDKPTPSEAAPQEPGSNAPANEPEKPKSEGNGSQDGSSDGTKSEKKAPTARTRAEGSHPSDSPTREHPPTQKQNPASSKSGISDSDLAKLHKWLEAVGAPAAPVKLMARSAERQARIMCDLAIKDVEAAKDMYCSAGDAVIDRFDPNKSREANIRTMQEELLAQLPAARSIGCLDHIANDLVYAVDVDSEAIPSEHHAELVNLAKRAVRAGELHAFRHPPSHRGAFHFEFDRASTASADGDDRSPKDERKPAVDDEPTK